MYGPRISRIGPNSKSRNVFLVFDVSDIFDPLPIFLYLIYALLGRVDINERRYWESTETIFLNVIVCTILFPSFLNRTLVGDIFKSGGAWDKSPLWRHGELWHHHTSGQLDYRSVQKLLRTLRRLCGLEKTTDRESATQIDLFYIAW